jgi:hypothetical protein
VQQHGGMRCATTQRAMSRTVAYRARYLSSSTTRFTHTATPRHQTGAYLVVLPTLPVRSWCPMHPAVVGGPPHNSRLPGCEMCSRIDAMRPGLSRQGLASCTPVPNQHLHYGEAVKHSGPPNRARRSAVWSMCTGSVAASVHNSSHAHGGAATVAYNIAMRSRYCKRRSCGQRN